MPSKTEEDMDMRAYSMEAWNAPHPAGASPGPLGKVAGPRRVGRAESRATVITDAWTPWDAYTDVLR